MEMGYGQSHYIKGILLGKKGYTGIEVFKDFLRELTGRDDLFFKESFSDRLPFNRMLVKVKQQIIPVDDPAISPTQSTAPHLSPETLKQWLDEGKDFVLLDTRNQFEFQVGTFEGALQMDLPHFRYFEGKLKDLPDDLKAKPVVAFCTGGIRCEKATPLMEKHGFKEVYQLDGGILNYFQKVGGAHYQGDCFVFDRRVALNSKLEETQWVECYNCWNPVTPQEQKLDSYVYGKQCPHCVDLSPSIIPNKA